jgi:hypothetical protein
MQPKPPLSSRKRENQAIAADFIAIAIARGQLSILQIANSSQILTAPLEVMLTHPSIARRGIHRVAFSAYRLTANSDSPGPICMFENHSQNVVLTDMLHAE